MQTRGERMLALRRARMAASPAFFRGGFRPFFFLAALYAGLAIPAWLWIYAAGGALPGAGGMPPRRGRPSRRHRGARLARHQVPGRHRQVRLILR